ncbi:MAG: pyrroline-5-carboxylate reductase family protein, partial [Bacteroidia bacterium]
MKIAIVGAGNMGLTYAHGFIHTSIVKPAQLYFIDRSQRRLPEISKVTSNPVRSVPDDFLADMDLIVLAVKPQDFEDLAADLGDFTHPDQLILSIMAGKSIATIREWLGTPKVIRAMPNLPAQVGQGMTVFTTTPDVSRSDLLTVHNLLNTTGKTLYVDNEMMVDAAT